MPKLTHLSFQVLPDGRVEAHYQYDDGMLTSFDTAQLPEKVAPLVAELAAAQQERIKELEPLAAEAAARPITQAELDAANANVQALLAQVEALQTRDPGPVSAVDTGGG